MRLDDLYSLIWAEAKDPLALYLRGSALGKEGLVAPWDLDLLLVLADNSEETEQLYRRCRERAANLPELPELDLTCIGRSCLLEDERTLLKRILLQMEGRLVRGEDLCAKIDMPSFNDELGERLKAIYERIVRRKIGELPRAGLANAHLYQRTLAKAALRAAATAALGAFSEFAREPRRCAELTELLQPSKRESAQYMMAIVRGDEGLPEDLSRHAVILCE